MINILVDSRGLEEAKKLLANMPGAFEKSQGAALGRTLTHMKAQAAQLTSARYYAQSGEIKRSISIKRGTGYGAIISRGKRKSISDYYLTPKKPPVRGKAKLRGAVKRTGIKSLGRAFYIRLGGKYYPYYRVGRGKWDIKRLTSPAIPQIMKNEEITEKLSSDALKYYNERLNHEIMHRLGVYVR